MQISHRNLQETAGNHRILQESTGTHRKLKEMSERVEFHAKLATRGRVYIPKIMVERWVHWKDALTHFRVLLCGDFSVHHTKHTISETKRIRL